MLPLGESAQCKQEKQRRNRKKCSLQIVSHTIERTTSMRARPYMCGRALSNQTRARIHSNWHSCLSSDISAARVATEDLFGRAESCGRGGERRPMHILNRKSWSTIEMREAEIERARFLIGALCLFDSLWSPIAEYHCTCIAYCMLRCSSD